MYRKLIGYVRTRRRVYDFDYVHYLRLYLVDYCIHFASFGIDLKDVTTSSLWNTTCHKYN
jgi:hypothetical protein